MIHATLSAVGNTRGGVSTTHSDTNRPTQYRGAHTARTERCQDGGLPPREIGIGERRSKAMLSDSARDTQAATSEVRVMLPSIAQ